MLVLAYSNRQFLKNVLPCLREEGMEIKDFRLRRYYNLLKALSKRQKEINPTDTKFLRENTVAVLNILEKIAVIFHKEDHKEAEEILLALWSYDNDAIKLFILLNLLDAVSKRKSLSPKTVIKLEQIENHPIYSSLFVEAVWELRRLKAPWN